MTKTKLVQALSEQNDITRAQAKGILDSLYSIAENALREEGSFTLPDVVKLTLKDVPAQPERQTINPFTKLPHTSPPRPASKKVKASPAATIKKAFQK